jgi:uncharacterized membrane protein
MLLAFNPLLNSEGQTPPVGSWIALAVLLLIAALYYSARARRRR